MLADAKVPGSTRHLRLILLAAVLGVALIALFVILQKPGILIPAWEIPAAHQPTQNDWVDVTLLSPVRDTEIPSESGEVKLRVRYSLTSHKAATLMLQLRSRLDLDIVDLGSDLSNILAIHPIEIQNGSGEEIVTLNVDPGTLSRFPPGSEVIIIASLQDHTGAGLRPAGDEYFHKVFVDQSFSVPDYSQACTFDASRDKLRVTGISQPAGSVLSEENARVEVTIDYAFTDLQARLLTIAGGLVGEGSTTGDFENSQWETQGAWAFSNPESASGKAMLNVGAWHPIPGSPFAIEGNNKAHLVIFAVCDHASFFRQPRVIYSEFYPENDFTFSLSQNPPTPVPNPAP
jgi:hypothetical protein